MAVADLELNGITQQKERSLWRKSMDRLLRNKIAVISGIFIILMILMLYSIISAFWFLAVGAVLSFLTT